MKSKRESYSGAPFSCRATDARGVLQARTVPSKRNRTAPFSRLFVPRTAAALQVLAVNESPVVRHHLLAGITRKPPLSICAPWLHNFMSLRPYSLYLRHFITAAANVKINVRNLLTLLIGKADSDHLPFSRSNARLSMRFPNLINKQRAGWNVRVPPSSSPKCVFPRGARCVGDKLELETASQLYATGWEG